MLGKYPKVIWGPYISNRADGVDGHYCIARKVIDYTGFVYSEFWHEDCKWCSAGTVYIGIDASNKLSQLLKEGMHEPT